MMLLKVNDTVYKCTWVSLNNNVLTLFDEGNNVVFRTSWDKVHRFHVDSDGLTYMYNDNKIYRIEGSMIKNINLEDIPYEEDKDILYYGLLYEYCDLFGDKEIIIIG